MPALKVKLYGVIPLTPLFYYPIIASFMIITVLLQGVVYYLQDQIMYVEVFKVVVYILMGLELLECGIMSLLYYRAAGRMKAQTEAASKK